MSIYRMQADSFSAIKAITFAEAGLRERADLQRRIKANVDILSPSLMVIAEEFADWTDSNRRIDLLCLDKEASLVVVELKRSEDAGHSELQALRYAAMVATMTFRQLVDIHARYGSKEPQKAEADILAFLEWASPQEEEFGEDVRIILAAADFSREVTTTVLWLNTRGIDIRCVRLKPYRLEDGSLIVDAQQIIPLPEAGDYLTKIKDKRDEERRGRGERHELRREFWTGLLALAKKEGALHGHRSPTTHNWIGGGQGVNLNYVIRQADCRVEVYIDRGEEDANLRSFEFFEQQRAAIEAITGPLHWDRLPGARACRISCAVVGGYQLPKEDWPLVFEAMVEAAKKMQQAFDPRLDAAAVR